MNSFVLLLLVLIPIVGSFISYLIGRKNKVLRDYFVAGVCILDLAIMFYLSSNVILTAPFS